MVAQEAHFVLKSLTLLAERTVLALFILLTSLSPFRSRDQEGDMLRSRGSIEQRIIKGQPPGTTAQSRLGIELSPLEDKAKRSRLPLSLSNERGRVKAALTRLKTFYDTRGDAEPIPSLRLRLSQNLDLRQRYDAIHDRIIAAVAGSDDVEAHERSRDEFEDTYYRTYDGHSAGTIANTADDLTSTSPTAPPTAHQSHYRGVADQKRSPKHKSARNRQQAHRDDRCQLNRLRIIGNTGFINAIRSSENIARKEVLHSDNEHYRNRADNIANVPRRYSKIRSVARRNYASAGIQPVAKASATIGTVPTTKFDTVNDRQRNPIADRATRVQRQPQFVRRAAGETVREYQGCVLNANLRPAEQHSQSYRQQRVPAAPKPAQTRAVENPVPQSRSVTIQRPFRAKSVDALEKLARDSQIARDPQITRVSRLLQLEGAVSERSRADHDARITARPRSPQDLGSRREPEQLVPQPLPADRVQIQDNSPANTHVVIHGKMNLKREPFHPDIDDAHHANDSNIIKLTMIIPEGRDHNGGFLAANYGKQQ
ncbi:hypothetical protein WN51_09913 [Melipona quadrifasciata]|uniref:Uncharacterized protein n=1 Tax=Melipona quadrifasciata TaxID=166423 RepID=A0A0M9AA68_9HYME|nr:hypothetical protein WN51_09913 [Melipona quadrifasciata]